MNAIPLISLGLGLAAFACSVAFALTLINPRLLDTQLNRLLTVGYFGGLLMAVVGGVRFFYFLLS